MKLYDSLPTPLAQWALTQPIFFTASAPTHGRHVNVSPKGLSSHFAVLNPNLVAYIDRTGSGCETVAHSYENGRLTLMFLSFGPSPRIMRLFCRSKVVEYRDGAEFTALLERIRTSGTATGSGIGVGSGGRETFDGARAVVLGSVFCVQTSCGYGVPMVKKELYLSQQPSSQTSNNNNDIPTLTNDQDTLECKELRVFEERPTLDTWAKKQVEARKFGNYRLDKNSRSLDGLPGLRAARRDIGEWVVVGEVLARLQRVRHEKVSVAVGFLLAVVMYIVGRDLAGF